MVNVLASCSIFLIAAVLIGVALHQAVASRRLLRDTPPCVASDEGLVAAVLMIERIGREVACEPDSDPWVVDFLHRVHDHETRRRDASLRGRSIRG